MRVLESLVSIIKEAIEEAVIEVVADLDNIVEETINEIEEEEKFTKSE